jgi:DNA polymerase elongation subunit (family B)
MNKPKILLWDIETAPNQVLTFGIHQQDINPANIMTEWYIICISYQWYGEKTIHTISILDDPKRFRRNVHDDYYVLSEFRKVIEQADAHVAHYGDGFDFPKFNSRMIINGLEPLPRIISLDTVKIARRYFKFNSNKLDYLARLLGYKGKIDNPKSLWRDCFEGKVPAIKYMSKYNRNDVDILRFVFERLLPFVKNYPLNMGIFMSGMRCVNPTCGSVNIQLRGYNYTRTGKYQRFQCTDCGAWGQAKKQTLEGSVDVK